MTATTTTKGKRQAAAEDEEEDNNDQRQQHDEEVAASSAQKHSNSPLCKRIKCTEKEESGYASSSSNSDPAPPPYASKEYWENRYREQFDRQKQEKDSTTINGSGGVDDNKKTAIKNSDFENDDKNNADTIPYHAWYFTFNELRPLLLPLILGDRHDYLQHQQQVEASISDSVNVPRVDVMDESNSRIGESSSSVDNPQEIKTQDTPAEEEEEEEENGAGDDDDDDDSEVDEMQDDDDEEEEDEENERYGLAKDGPVSVMEIGCGDAPLGADLALELKNMQENNANGDVVQRIVCIDYSEIVVETMKKKYKTSSSMETTSAVKEATTTTTTATVPTDSTSTSPCCVDVGNIPLDFKVADARNLPYPNESFDLILEKGTLDAMASSDDEDNQQQGIADCATIVSECARVLKTGGYIMIISHLNANTPQGIRWLQDVVLEGIQQQQQQQQVNISSSDDDHDDDDGRKTTTASWEIEVHGNEPPKGETPGPAVYIIHKMPGTTTTSTTTTANEGDAQPEDEEERPTIPVKFFGY